MSKEQQYWIDENHRINISIILSSLILLASSMWCMYKTPYEVTESLIPEIRIPMIIGVIGIMLLGAVMLVIGMVKDFSIKVKIKTEKKGDE